MSVLWYFCRLITRCMLADKNERLLHPTLSGSIFCRWTQGKHKRGYKFGARPGSNRFMRTILIVENIARLHDCVFPRRAELSGRTYQSDGVPAGRPPRPIPPSRVIVSLSPTRSKQFNARSQHSSIYRLLLGIQHAMHIIIILRRFLRTCSVNRSK